MRRPQRALSCTRYQVKVWETWVEAAILGFKIKYISLLKIDTLNLIMRKHQSQIE